jgi:hypothetical protein
MIKIHHSTSEDFDRDSEIVGNVEIFVICRAHGQYIQHSQKQKGPCSTKYST